MNICLFQRLALLVGLTSVLTAPAVAGSINDPVVAVNGTSTMQQTLSVTISISGAPTGTTLYYTTDGSNPSMSGPSIASGGSILIAQNATLQVEAFQNATTTSDIVTEQFAVAGQVSAGTAHTLILENNGTVLATGDNSAGELGNGLTTNVSTPVQVKTGASTFLTGIVAIAADNDESFAVDGSGNVWAWGLNTNSQLGIGTSSNALYATQVTSLSNIVAIASSQNHTLAVSANGSVFGWGANTYGQVGNGTTSPWVTTPTPVLALSGIVAVAAGATHSLALTSGGNVYAWGGDAAGQLSDGDLTLTSQSLPVQVLSSGTAVANVVGIAAGTSNSFFLKSNGAAWSAGDNTIGELGQGTVSATPVIANLSAGMVTAITGMGGVVALSNQSALDSTGTLWTWGDNSTGKLAVGYLGYYATAPLAATLGTQGTPSLAITAGNNQQVTDGAFSNPLTISAPNGTWVNLIVNPTGGFLGLSSGATLLSPIIGGRVTSGSINFYLQAPSSGAGSVSLTATSGASLLSTISVIEQMAQGVATDTPTMPEWGLVVMAVLLVWTAARQRERLMR